MAEFYLRTHKLLPPRVGMIPLNQTTKTKQTDKTNRPRLQFPNTARPQHDEKKIISRDDINYLVGLTLGRGLE
jgi:hypothetical protein